ncbi:ESPR-type extended signal peptide-containing protein [uncultured Megasphaera sp.]|uniref:ESPR-type extended signal peptide-containing protein n=1 Tax=uncultured Megasphaera sp. TaxID=165188 RepID=UPI002604D769|nr:ESPR-type extended signal peptide-containing protein [uncultured Megasphaera sp.]
MNKIFKVIYSKTRHCYVVVSELAKSHCKTTVCPGKSKTALTAAVLLALGIGCGGLFYPMQVEAITDLSTNDYFTAYDKNYFDEDGNKSTDWDKAKVTNTDQDEGNVGAKDTGAIAAGLYAQAGQQTITIGNRNAGLSKGSVYVGEYTGYQNPTSGSIPEGLKSTYVTSVGFMSNATYTGTVAIGANATAEGEKNNVILGEGDLSKVLSENQNITGASVALGYSATAKAGNIAIGAYSDASTDLRADTSDAAKSYLTTQTADSYVSVGKSDALRRVSNVADGAADTDAATIAQLKEAVKATDASKKANIDASNIGKNLKKADGTTAAENADIIENEDAWGAAIGNGSIASPDETEQNHPKTNGSQQLVTGGTVYNYVKPMAVSGKTLHYISEDKPTGTNLGILDDQVYTNASDITNLKDLSNITDNGKTVIKKAAVGAVKVAAGDRVTVTKNSEDTTDADTVTYTISAKNDGKVESGNTDLVSGGTVYSALQQQANDLTYKAGWGIKIDSSKNVSLKNNLTTIIQTDDTKNILHLI